MTSRPPVRVAAPLDLMPPGHAEYEADELNAPTPDLPAEGLRTGGAGTVIDHSAEWLATSAAGPERARRIWVPGVPCGQSPMTHKTALVIIPPVTAWTPIQAIRAKQDPKARRWMPCITLIYLFLRAKEFGRAAGLDLRGTATASGTAGDVRHAPAPQRQRHCLATTGAGRTAGRVARGVVGGRLGGGGAEAAVVLLPTAPEHRAGPRPGGDDSPARSAPTGLAAGPVPRRPGEPHPPGGPAGGRLPCCEPASARRISVRRAHPAGGEVAGTPYPDRPQGLDQPVARSADQPCSGTRSPG
jgi:hypothetical protein